MGIRNYWKCVLPEGDEEPPLQRIIDQSTILATEQFSEWRFESDGEDLGGAEFACLGFTTGDIRAIAHLVKPHGRPNFYLHSAFPWVARGAPVRLKVHAVHTDDFGLEGFIEAGIEEYFSVTFFDPLYAMNKAGYKTGVDHNFTLGALSLNLKPAAQELVRIEHPETSAQLREIAAATGRPYAAGETIQVDTSNAKILLAADNGASDHYFFQGPVRTIRMADFLDRPFLVFRTAVLDLKDEDFTVDIYVDRARLESRIAPRIGDVVSGTLWLQGHLPDANT